MGLAMCILLSTLMWFVLALSSPQGYTKEVDVRVEWPALPAEYVVTDSTVFPRHLTVELHSSGFGLLRYTLNSLFRSVPTYTPIVNTSSLDTDGGTWELTDRQLKSQVLTNILPMAKAILTDTLLNVNIKPSTLKIPYEPLSSAEADVIFTSQVDFGEKPNLNLVGEVQLTPDKVMLYAAKSQIDSLSASHNLIVRTDTVAVRIGDPGKIRTAIALIPPANTRVQPDSVIVSLATEELTSRTFIATNIAVKGLKPGYTLHLLPEQVRVTYLIAKTSARDSALPDIQLYVDAGDIKTQDQKLLSVKVKNFPEEVQLIQLDPDRVSYILQEENGEERP